MYDPFSLVKAAKDYVTREDGEGVALTVARDRYETMGVSQRLSLASRARFVDFLLSDCDGANCVAFPASLRVAIIHTNDIYPHYKRASNTTST